MLKSLDCGEKTITLIAAISGTPRAQVKERLLAEAAEIGTTVFNGMTVQGVLLYLPSEKLDNFYVDSDTFLYETTV